MTIVLKKMLPVCFFKIKFSIKNQNNNSYQKYNVLLIIFVNFFPYQIEGYEGKMIFIKKTMDSIINMNGWKQNKKFDRNKKINDNDNDDV